METEKLNVGLLCNGRCTNAKEWESIIWGKNGLMGQIPSMLATLLYLEQPKEVVSIVFGSGGPKRDGIPEAGEMANFMMQNLHRLSEFPAFAEMTSKEIETLRSRLKKISHSEVVPKNTANEFEVAMSIFRSKGVELAVDITCATHAPRCTRDIIAVMEELGEKAPRCGSMVVPAQTHYAGASIKDVAVLEPPHKGDTPESFAVFHRLIMQIYSTFMKAPPEQRENILLNLGKVI